MSLLSRPPHLARRFLFAHNRGPPTRRCQAKTRSRARKQGDRITIDLGPSTVDAAGRRWPVLCADTGEVVRDYAEYLASWHWEIVRESHAGSGICWCCRMNRASETHHISYENLGAERDEDTVPLCRSCHSTAHGGDDATAFTVRYLAASGCHEQLRERLRRLIEANPLPSFRPRAAYHEDRSR